MSTGFFKFFPVSVSFPHLVPFLSGIHQFCSLCQVWCSLLSGRVTAYFSPLPLIYVQRRLGHGIQTLETRVTHPVEDPGGGVGQSDGLLDAQQRQPFLGGFFLSSPFSLYLRSLLLDKGPIHSISQKRRHTPSDEKRPPLLRQPFSQSASAAIPPARAMARFRIK